MRHSNLLHVVAARGIGLPDLATGWWARGAHPWALAGKLFGQFTPPHSSEPQTFQPTALHRGEVAIGISYLRWYAAACVAVFAAVGEVAGVVTNEELGVRCRILAGEVGGGAGARVECSCCIVERGGAFDAVAKAVVFVAAALG